MKTKKGFELRKVGNEDIIVASGIENIDFSSIISLNSSAALLWREVQDKEFSAETIAEILLNNYDIDEETANTDAVEVVEQWLAAGIISE
jgi:hypothetical protein